MMCGVDGDLDIVADNAGTAAAGRHRAGIGIGQRVLTLYSLYYNETRTHLGLCKDVPLGRHIERSGRSSSHQSCPDSITATRGYDFREGQMWLRGRLVPDHMTIADFRKDNGEAICKVCARFIMLCWALDLSLHAARPRATR
jgi:hypothetical protein